MITWLDNFFSGLSRSSFKTRFVTVIVCSVLIVVASVGLVMLVIHAFWVMVILFFLGFFALIAMIIGM